MKPLVIIPAFNEEMNIASLVKKIEDLSYDYIVVNDCSKDGTSKLLKDNGINHLDLPSNVGLASVTQMGFKYAVDNDYDCAIVIDGDGQHNPSYIADLFKKIEEGDDYVVGSRYLTEKKPWNLRMIGSRIIAFFILLKAHRKVTDPTSGMRCLGRKVLREFSEYMNFVAEPDALCHIIRKKYKYSEVQVSMNEREQGASYFADPFKSIVFMVKVLISIIFIQ